MNSWLPVLTIVVLFACLVTREYIKDLRAANKKLKSENDTAWRLYDNAHRELCAMKGLPVSESYFSPKEGESNQPPFSFSGIGITQIRDRELRQQREKESETQPRFDKSTLAAPSEGEIVATARRASGNNGN